MPFWALQVLSATTAIPFGTGTTAFTPRMAFAATSSSERILPPKMGDCRTVAKSISGNLISIPNLADPVTFSGTSMR